MEGKRQGWRVRCRGGRKGASRRERRGNRGRVSGQMINAINQNRVEIDMEGMKKCGGLERKIICIQNTEYTAAE